MCEKKSENPSYDWLVTELDDWDLMPQELPVWDRLLEICMMGSYVIIINKYDDFID